MPSLSSLYLPSFVLPLILISVPLPSGSNSLFSSCSGSFSCGNISGVTFPFWGGNRPYGCGYPQLELTCEENSAFLSIADVKYFVLGIEPEAHLLRIARQDFSDGICLTKYLNTTLDPELFDLAAGYMNISFLYGCPSMPFLAPFNCPGNGLDPGVYIFLGVNGPSGCKASVVVPVPAALPTDWNRSSPDLQSVLQAGFEVELKVDDEACSECVQSNGVCGYDPYANGTTCFCPGQSSGFKSCASTSTSSPAAPQGQPRQGNYNLSHTFRSNSFLGHIG